MDTFVLGANGRIGGVLWRHAQRSGAGWVGQSRHQGREVRWNGRFSSGPPSFLQSGSTVINMIGETGQDEEHLQALNVDFVRKLLIRAGCAGVAHVLLASSAAVYGAGKQVPFEEDAPLAPVNAYGRSKTDMEDIAHDLVARGSAPPVTILRIGNVAGSDTLTSVARSAAAKGKPLTLHRFKSGRTALRSYVGPDNLFRFISVLASNPPKTIQTFNICSPLPVRLDHLVSSYKSTIFPKLYLRDAPAPDTTPEEVVLSAGRLGCFVPMCHSASQPDEMAKQVAMDLAV